MEQLIVWTLYRPAHQLHNSGLDPWLQALDVVMLSLGICVAVGLIFGTAPALRASRLSPIDSLRHE